MRVREYVMNKKKKKSCLLRYCFTNINYNLYYYHYGTRKIKIGPANNILIDVQKKNNII